MIRIEKSRRTNLLNKPFVVKRLERQEAAILLTTDYAKLFKYWVEFSNAFTFSVAINKDHSWRIYRLKQCAWRKIQKVLRFLHVAHDQRQYILKTDIYYNTKRYGLRPPKLEYKCSDNTREYIVSIKAPKIICNLLTFALKLRTGK